MKSLRLAAVAAIAAAITLLSPGGAQAYPDAPNVTITIPDSVLYGGDTFTYTAQADVECDWTITYDEGRGPGVDKNQYGSGTSLSGSYKTMVVDEIFKSPITALCDFDDGVPPVSAKVVTSNEVTQAAAQTAQASAVITLLPRDGDGDADGGGVLPSTGGMSFWYLVLGGALVVGGGATLYASRRRHVTH